MSFNDIEKHMNSIFNQRKRIRHEIVHFSVDYLKKLFPSMPPYMFEFIIKLMHYQSVFCIFAAVLFAPSNIFRFTLLMSIIIISLFVIFDGCLVSMIEYKFCPDKSKYINIVDPFLVFIHKEISNGNRYFYTLYIALAYFLCCLLRMAYEHD